MFVLFVLSMMFAANAVGQDAVFNAQVDPTCSIFPDAEGELYFSGYNYGTESPASLVVTNNSGGFTLNVLSPSDFQIKPESYQDYTLASSFVEYELRDTGANPQRVNAPSVLLENAGTDYIDFMVYGTTNHPPTAGDYSMAVVVTCDML